MSLISKRRVASLASASALVATMAVTAAPAATLAAESGLTGFTDRDGTTLTAKIIDPVAPVTGTITADGYDIGVYYSPGHSGTVTADISGAKYYGVVADGAKVNVTGSKVHDIGDQPSRRHQPAVRHAARPCHRLHQRRERHDQRQQGLRLPEERDRGQRPDRRWWQRLRQPHDVSLGHEQRRHRRGAHQHHRPERHRDPERRERHGEQEHNQQLVVRDRTDTEAAGVLLYSAGRVNVQNNKISDSRVAD